MDFGLCQSSNTKLKGITNSCNLWLIIKLNNLLDIYKWGCGPFCVSLLTARLLKPLRADDFVYVYQQRAFIMSARDM